MLCFTKTMVVGKEWLKAPKACLVNVIKFSMNNYLDQVI